MGVYQIRQLETEVVCMCGVRLCVCGGGELGCIRVVWVWVCECMWGLIYGDRKGGGAGHHIFNTGTKFSLEAKLFL